MPRFITHDVRRVDRVSYVAGRAAAHLACSVMALVVSSVLSNSMTMPR
jgi:hypothetical protein